MEQSEILPTIEKTIKTLKPEEIPSGRKIILQPLIEFIKTKVLNEEEIRLQFICTHNSRRSILGQVWAQTLAHYFNLNSVFCYSGGTESTELYPMIAETLERSGFEITLIGAGTNPIYSINYSENEHPIIGFSKKFESDFNPKSEFAAILTCSSADEDCPFIPGAKIRIPLTFEDPKIYDNTPERAEKYKERSLQIATELFYVFSQINS